MITPQFSVTQDDRFVYVNIRAPYIKASMIQFEVEGDLFVFSLPPYYLRLHLPGQIIEDEHMSSSYDLETSTVKCVVSKQVQGQNFEDLEMLSKMLARKEGPKIEELDEDAQLDEEVDFEEIDQTVHQPINGIKYGFNNAYNEIIGLSLHSGNEINELDDPEHTPPADRKGVNDNLVEKYGFDVEYYFSDLFENPMIEVLISELMKNHTMSSEDQDKLLKLPKRKVISTSPKETYVGLISLLFAQAYDSRINSGEPTVESAWCIGKLTPSMSCLLTGTNVKYLVASCTQRSLLFPLYRNWDLSLKVWNDVLSTLLAGRSAILQRLVYLMRVFEHEQHSAYNTIWLEDYALWIQYANDKVIQGLYTELEKALGEFKKADVGLELDEYEEAAREAVQEQANGDSDDESDNEA